VTFVDRIADAPHRFSFYELVRRIECENPDRPRIGESQRPVDDPVRLGQFVSLGFAPASVAAVRRGKDGRPDTLLVHFFGLLGPNGPLPLHLTEFARQRKRDFGDATFARFLDMFHHRLLTFFYRIWASSQPTVDFDRPGRDRFPLYIGALLGIGLPSLRERDDMPDALKLYFASRLALSARNEEGLRAILGHFFDAPFRIAPFLGHWLDIPEQDIWLLGRSMDTGQLGQNTNLGARVWECQQKFRVVAGPLSLIDFKRFLPGGRALVRLAAIVRNYVGDELAWDLQLVLRADAVPALALDGSVPLGLATWLISRIPPADVGDVVIEGTEINA
jgi:type VI secretion system protein ImpH